MQADATKEVGVTRIVETCLDRYGRIDILDNNVGIAEVGGVVDLSEEAWDRMFAINLKTRFLAIVELGVVDAPERPVLAELDIGADEQRQQAEHGEPEITDEFEGDHG